MESMNEVCSGLQVSGSVFLFHHASTSFADSFHQRSSSESFLMEDRLSWLDDLLNESETPVIGGHRRSASDTCAYLGETVDTFNILEKSKFESAYIGASTGSRNLVQYKASYSTSVETKTVSLDEGNKKESEMVLSDLAEEQNGEESSPQNLEGSTGRANGSQAKPSPQKIDAKRAKQNTAHRSRVRKFQYIGQLERTVQLLQAEGCEVSAEVEFLEQHNTILTMENKALRQHLESLSQEMLIKHYLTSFHLGRKITMRLAILPWSKRC